MPRLPRLRRPRLRERPINASSEPLEKEEPATKEESATATIAPAEPVPDAPPPDLAEEAPARRRRLRIPRPRLPRPRRPRLRRREPGPGPTRRPIPRAVKLAGAAAVLLAGAVVALVAFGVFGPDEESATPVGPAPPLHPATHQGGQPAAEQAAEELGFPAFATKNTTRVGGADAVSDAAGVALATFPSAGSAEPPAAVTLVDENDWPAGIAAATLTADPIGAPILLSSADGVPDQTAQALDALAPEGSAETDGAQVFAVGDVAVPDGLQVKRVHGGGAAAVAASIDRLRARLTGQDPRHIVIVPARQPAFAMPAAAWAARSGDAVLFAGPESVPKRTAKALHRYKGARVYVLGPSSAISSDAVRTIDKLAGRVHRVSGEDPVSNAIEFARYADGSFGWNINDPGHGFVVARDLRPLDAAAAAPLSASGTWGPLLLTDSAASLPGALRGYLLDVKPGYRSDPTRALYNHVWVIGNEDAIGVSQQATIDDLAELTRISGGGR